MAKAPAGRGTVYKENHPTRKTKWRAEKTITLPTGESKRVIARGRTQTDALDKLEQRTRRLMLANPSAERMTMSQYLDKWLAFKRPTLKPRTIREYTDALRVVRDRIGHIPLAKVKPTHIQDVLTSVQAEGHFAKAANVRRYLKQALTQAERWELLQRSPIRHIRPIKTPPTQRHVWTPDEIQRFLEVAKTETHKGYYALFYAAIWTGMRRGELLALPWKNVSPDSILVDRTEGKRYYDEGHGTTKTPAGHRTIPINKVVYDVIADATDGTWAFPSNASTMIEYGNHWKTYSRIVRKAGVRPIKFHHLRRTSATLWARAGHSPRVIQYLLGHSTPHVALAIYTDVYEKDLRNAALDPLSIIGGKKGGNESGGDENE